MGAATWTPPEPKPTSCTPELRAADARATAQTARAERAEAGVARHLEDLTATRAALTDTRTRVDQLTEQLAQTRTDAEQGQPARPTRPRTELDQTRTDAAAAAARTDAAGLAVRLAATEAQLQQTRQADQ